VPWCTGMRSSPPRDIEELSLRARALEGRSLASLLPGGAHGFSARLAREKGALGQLIESVLGASAGSRACPDFHELGIELKTIPVDAQGKPRESTFVCYLSLADADRIEFDGSPVWKKLSHVLWVPIIGEGDERVIGSPLFWQPSVAQREVLRADFDDIVGLVATGRIEDLTARVGRWLQARPKAAHSRVRTRAYGPDDEPMEALPRGFYLRARFTQALLKDPQTLAHAGED